MHLELVAVALFLSLSLRGLNTNFFVVLLQGRQVLTSLAELAFFHAFSDIPVNECTLAVHKIELMVNAGEHFGNGGGIADHAARTHDLGKISAWNHCGWLIVDAAFKSSGAPIHELDSALGLDCCHR